ncbi:MAG: hypothetical protein K2K53_11495 [Oscillospiraceae bacterium]|nr:hypothetical protein [Oscillospiraceae bacterium]
MARKKIVFVIVEGPSDETALGAILSRFYDGRFVYLHVMRRDITTEDGINPSNIVATLGDIIKAYARDNHFDRIHFQEVIHLVDMDGAYIPDENVVEDAEQKAPLYTPTEIRTANRVGILKRNEQKRQNLDRLCGLSKIWELPYRVYFMSCNLDHVLYDKQNSSDQEKEDDSYAFARKYKEKPMEFVEYISSSAFSVMNGYRESWEFVKQDLHSLERYTNFGLCFQKTEAEDAAETAGTG